MILKVLDDLNGDYEGTVAQKHIYECCDKTVMDKRSQQTNRVHSLGHGNV